MLGSVRSARPDLQRVRHLGEETESLPPLLHDSNGSGWHSDEDTAGASRARARNERNDGSLHPHSQRRRASGCDGKELARQLNFGPNSPTFIANKGHVVP